MINERTRKQKLKAAFDHAMVSQKIFCTTWLYSQLTYDFLGAQLRVQGLLDGSYDDRS